MLQQEAGAADWRFWQSASISRRSDLVPQTDVRPRRSSCFLGIQSNYGGRWLSCQPSWQPRPRGNKVFPTFLRFFTDRRSDLLLSGEAKLSKEDIGSQLLLSGDLIVMS